MSMSIIGFNPDSPGTSPTTFGNAYLGGIFLGTANFAPTGRAVIRSSVKDKKETDIFFMKILA